MVVLAHAGFAWFEGGYVGVDVFFVLSGYLITGLLLEERLAAGTIDYRRFVARRLRRLLPAMLTMLLVVLLVSLLVLTSFEMRMQSRSFPYAAAWISNLFFAFAERDYFRALQDEDLFLHTWSLGVEEQFYLVWPWLVLAFVAVRTRSSDRRDRGRAIAAAFGIILIASLALSLYLSRTFPILAFYMMPSRVWQFALGALVYVGIHVASSPPAKERVGRGWLAGLGGIALVVGSGIAYTADITYPGWYAVAPSVGAALLITAGALAPASGVAAALRTSVFVWLGDRSYSIYLWHWPILLLGNVVGLADGILGIATLILLSVLLADVTYGLVEVPFWKGRYREAIPRHVVAYAVAAILISVTAYLSLERQIFGTRVLDEVAREYDPRNDADPRVYSASRICDQGQFGTDILPCPLGNRDAPRLAVLISDSIGAQWSPALSAMLDEDWQFLVLTKSACAIVDKTYYYDKVGGDYVVCTEWRNKVLEYVSEIRPDVVFVGSSSAYAFTESDWMTGTRAVLQRLSPAARQVFIIPGTPSLSFDGPSCLEDPWRFSFRLMDGEKECEERQSSDRPAEVAAYLRAAAEPYANVAVVEIMDLVCPGGRCAAASGDGIPVFRDNAHITASFAFSLAPALRERLEALGISLSKPAHDTD